MASYRSLLADLDRVHVRVSLAGRALERTLEARENLTHIIYWDQSELFDRDVVGLVRARGTLRIKAYVTKNSNNTRNTRIFYVFSNSRENL